MGIKGILYYAGCPFCCKNVGTPKNLQENQLFLTSEGKNGIIGKYPLSVSPLGGKQIFKEKKWKT